MDARQNKKKVRELVTERLRRYFEELKQKCADAEEYLRKAIEQRRVS